ncbi:MAG: MBL fold metallo-hydrolase [Candidatus Thermoplasmatota archaeon]|nr:MBL fold metallo-hydrolase [Candidatus Thermoplasmatota archaeon]
MKINGYELMLASDGTFKLDGGAMFGVVPKPVWEKYFKSDVNNKITLATNVLVIRKDKNVALVDLGMGDKFDSKLERIYEINRTKTLLQDLSEKGIGREDVTHILITHGHLDHTGWATFNRQGTIEPTFPNARYFIQEETLKEIREPNQKTRPNYNYLNFENLDSHLELLNGDEEVFPGVELVKSGGHTKGHQIVILRIGNNTFTYFGDLIPTSAHIKPAYVMAYDLYPMDTFSKKIDLLQKAFDERWTLFFEHDPVMPAAKITDIEKYSLGPVSI